MKNIFSQKKHSHLTKNTQGFTLVELLVVIVIIGILAAAAMSTFSGATDKAQVTAIKADVATLYSSLTMYNASEDEKFTWAYDSDENGTPDFTFIPLSTSTDLKTHEDLDTKSNRDIVGAQLIEKGYIDKVPVNKLHDNGFIIAYDTSTQNQFVVIGKIGLENAEETIPASNLDTEELEDFLTSRGVTNRLQGFVEKGSAGAIIIDEEGDDIVGSF